MSSGLRFNEDYGAVSDVTRMLYLEPDTAGFAYAQPLAHPVGEVWSYSSGTANIVARIVQDTAGAASPIQRPPVRASRHAERRHRARRTRHAGRLVVHVCHRARLGAASRSFCCKTASWQGQQLLPDGFVDMMAEPVPASARPVRPRLRLAVGLRSA